jgi:hypothetical protein
VRVWPGWENRYTAAEGLDVRQLADAVAWLRDLVEAAEHAVKGP